LRQVADRNGWTCRSNQRLILRVRGCKRLF
jgi:hypothetical protein